MFDCCAATLILCDVYFEIPVEAFVEAFQVSVVRVQ